MSTHYVIPFIWTSRKRKISIMTESQSVFQLAEWNSGYYTAMGHYGTSLSNRSILMSLYGFDYTGIHICQTFQSLLLLHINDYSINLILKVKIMLYYKRYSYVMYCLEFRSWSKQILKRHFFRLLGKVKCPWLVDDIKKQLLIVF